MDGFNPETGELPEPLASVSERAMLAGREERREKRAAAMGVGSIGLYGKLAKAYAHIAPVLAKETQGQRGAYTSLDSVLRAVRKPLLDAGVLIRQGADRVFPMGDGTQKSFWTIIYTDLIDTTTGEVQRTELPMPIAQANPQAVGAVMTYGRRYTLLAALGIASGEPGEDDDAQSAMPRDLDEETLLETLTKAVRTTADLAAYFKWIKDHGKAAQQMLESDDFDKLQAVCREHKKLLSERQNAEAEPLSGDAPAPAKAPKGGPKNRIAPTHDGGSA
jgi:hypothetical protein